MSFWSIDFTKDFITQYKSYNCLWEVKCKTYHDRILKQRAYTSLIKFINENNGVSAPSDLNYVKSKINSLRTAYRREHAKIENSKKSGCGIEDVYVTKFPYYEELKFLSDDIPRPSRSSLIDEQNDSFNVS